MGTRHMAAILVCTRPGHSTFPTAAQQPSVSLGPKSPGPETAHCPTAQGAMPAPCLPQLEPRASHPGPVPSAHSFLPCWLCLHCPSRSPQGAAASPLLPAAPSYTLCIPEEIKHQRGQGSCPGSQQTLNMPHSLQWLGLAAFLVRGAGEGRLVPHWGPPLLSIAQNKVSRTGKPGDKAEQHPPGQGIAEAAFIWAYEPCLVPGQHQ